MVRLDLKRMPDDSSSPSEATHNEESALNEEANAFNSTEDFREGINEIIGDEAQMAQKTAYQLSYTSKFK